MWLILIIAITNYSFSMTSVATTEVEYSSAAECAHYAPRFGENGTPITIQRNEYHDPEIVAYRTVTAFCAGTPRLPKPR